MTEVEHVYTRKGLANECGISLPQLDYHVKTGTCNLAVAKYREPGVGILFNGPKARRFIEAMRAKHIRRQAVAAE